MSENPQYVKKDMRGKIEIGYNTNQRLWFLQYLGETRQPIGSELIANNQIILKNVPIDTYQWQDMRNPNHSHGRFMFYDGCDIHVKRDSVLAKSATITGNRNELNFVKISAKDIEFKYNLPQMTWTIIADGNSYETNNIVGIFNDVKFTGSRPEEKIRAYIHNQEFLFSWLITLFNSNLNIKNEKKPMSKDQCFHKPKIEE